MNGNGQKHTKRFWSLVLEDGADGQDCAEAIRLTHNLRHYASRGKYVNIV